MIQISISFNLNISRKSNQNLIKLKIFDFPSKQKNKIPNTLGKEKIPTPKDKIKVLISFIYKLEEQKKRKNYWFIKYNTILRTYAVTRKNEIFWFYSKNQLSCLESCNFFWCFFIFILLYLVENSCHTRMIFLGYFSILMKFI